MRGTEGVELGRTRTHNRLRLYRVAAATAALALPFAAAAAAGGAVDAAGTPGLVAAYSFDDGAGTTVADASGNGNTGTLVNTSWTRAGRFGGALAFDGTDSMVSVPDSASLDLRNAMTLEAWVEPQRLAGMWRTVIVKEQPSHLVYALYAAADTGTPSGHVNGGDDRWARDPSPLPLGSWSFLAATYDGTVIRLYVDGAEVAELADTQTMAPSPSPLRIGGNTIWNEWFAGLIDNVRIYDRALAPDEIRADMDAPVAATASTAQSAPSGASRRDTKAPTAPTRLVVRRRTSTTIGLSWRASRDNVGVAGYAVYVGAHQIGTTRHRTFVVSGLACARRYALSVRAFDAAGNRSHGAAVRGRTRGCAATHTAPPEPVPVPAPPPPAAAASVFVSPSGSDAGSCSRANPCRSFDRAYHVAAPGAVVQVAGGRYGNQSLSHDPAKTSAAHVVLEPADGASVAVGTVDVHGADHLTIANMTVHEWHTFQGTDDVTIQNVDAGDFYIDSSSRISVVGGSVGPQVNNDDAQIRPACADCPLPTDILVDGVRFHDATLAPGSDAHVECLQVAEIDGLTIRNSRFVNCETHNVFISPWWGTLEKNILLENDFGGVVRTGYYGFRIANGGGTCDNVTFRYDSALTPFLMECGTVRNGARMIADVGPITSRLCDSSITYSHNVWQGGVCGPTDVDAPSDFVDPAASDLHLRPGAPAIGRGDPSAYPATDIDGQPRPLGSAPDAGADEAG